MNVLTQTSQTDCGIEGVGYVDGRGRKCFAISIPEAAKLAHRRENTPTIKVEDRVYVYDHYDKITRQAIFHRAVHAGDRVLVDDDRDGAFIVSDIKLLGSMPYVEGHGCVTDRMHGTSKPVLLEAVEDMEPRYDGYLRHLDEQRIARNLTEPTPTVLVPDVGRDPEGLDDAV